MITKRNEISLLTQALEGEVSESPERDTIEDHLEMIAEMPGAGRATALNILWAIGRLWNDIQADETA